MKGGNTNDATITKPLDNQLLTTRKPLQLKLETKIL